MFNWFKKKEPAPVRRTNQDQEPRTAVATLIDGEEHVTCPFCGDAFQLFSVGLERYYCSHCYGPVLVQHPNGVRPSPAAMESSTPNTDPNSSPTPVTRLDFILIDGSNVMRSYRDGQVSLDVLLTIALMLVQKGISFFCIFDANARYVIREGDSPEDEEVYAKLLTRLQSHFAEATGGVPADEFLLLRADKRHCSILTNDRFRNADKGYTNRFPWVETASERLLKGKVMGDAILIPSLGIDVPPRTNIAELFDELCKLTA
jgi:Zc3h12a-like Ribonuclease NYN domain